MAGGFVEIDDMRMGAEAKVRAAAEDPGRGAAADVEISGFVRRSGDFGQRLSRFDDVRIAAPAFANSAAPPLGKSHVPALMRARRSRSASRLRSRSRMVCAFLGR
jgi:hypothetical protein